MWWRPYKLWKRDIILSNFKARIRNTSQKYVKEIPTSAKHANDTNRKNKNTLWIGAIAKDMTEVGVVFEVLEDGKVAPIGWKKVTVPLLWYVNMGFTQKARCVLYGNKNPDPIVSNYAGVVSRESVGIAFTYANPNGIDAFVADITNLYSQSPSSCKEYIIF